MLKKIISALLVPVMVLFAGCGSSQTDDNPSEIQNSTQKVSAEIQLLYCANDTMNPFNTISKLNAELGLLLFDPLVKYTNEFETVYCLATNVELQDKNCTVTLRNAKFSDGSAVTADDVIYSYNLAKNSARFSSDFYEVESVSAIDSEHIVFSLNSADPYFEKLLTFPIIKKGSDQLKNEDNLELAPIGSGRFVFDEKNAVLTANSYHYVGSGSIEKISLINAPDSESMSHYVEIGATDIYFAEMNDDTIIRMNSKKTVVNRNNLIYLGINHNYAPLKSDELRFAISAAISREDIVNKAFYSNAVAATGFFHPDFNDVSDYQSIKSSADKKISVENLAKIGYNRLNTDRFYENTGGKIIELTLLVNKDSSSKLSAAKLIAERLADAGIKVTINAVSKNSYFSALESGQFQLYIGEVKLLPNMDIRPLVQNGGSAAWGIVAPEVLHEEAETEENLEVEQPFDNETSYLGVLNGFYNGNNTVVDLATALQSSMPIIPLVYRNSLVFYSNDIEDVFSPSYSDIFISINKYHVKK